MKIEVHEGIVKGIPIALLVTFLIQGAGAVWWISAKARDNFFLEQRVASVEAALNVHHKVEEGKNERLARIEERLVAQRAVLDRIEKQLSALQR